MHRPRSLTENTAASAAAARNSCGFIMAIELTANDCGQRRRVAQSNALAPYERSIAAACPAAAGALYSRQIPAKQLLCKATNRHETGHASQLPYHQGRHDRRHRVHHALDLGQARGHAAPRHRSKIAPGLDRRPAAAGRPRRPAVALPEEVLGLLEEIGGGAFYVPERRASDSKAAFNSPN